MSHNQDIERSQADVFIKKPKAASLVSRACVFWFDLIDGFVNRALMSHIPAWPSWLLEPLGLPAQSQLLQQLPPCAAPCALAAATHARTRDRPTDHPLTSPATGEPPLGKLINECKWYCVGCVMKKYLFAI